MSRWLTSPLVSNLVAISAGGYAVFSYGKEKFVSLTQRMQTEKAGRENLKRRFAQNQEDCLFTVLALLPELGAKVLEEVDVEKVTGAIRDIGERQKREKEVQERERQEKEDELRLQKERRKEIDESGIIVNMNGEGESMNGSMMSDTEEKNGKVNGIANEHLEGSTSTLETSITSLPTSPYATANGQDTSSSPTPASTPLPTVPAIDIDLAKKKAQLWSELKIISFVQPLTLLYSLPLLVLLTHLQLNLLGRYAYLDSVIAMNLSDVLRGKLGDKKVETRAERQFLTFSWWVLNKGWRSVSDRVKEATDEVFGSISLKAPLRYTEVCKLIDRIRHKVEFNEDGSPFSFASLILPPPDAETSTLYLSGLAPSDCQMSSTLSKLLSETRDFLDSPDFNLVLSLQLYKIFEHFLNSLEPLFKSPPSQRNEAEEEEIRWDLVGAKKGVRFEENEKSVRLATLLPTVARQSKEMIHSMPNEWIETLAEVRELKEWSVVIYSAFDPDETCS